MKIFQGLKTYRDRMDKEKSSMRLWTLNALQKLNDSRTSPEIKSWCVLSISISEQVYEFFIDNYRGYFKGVEASGGLREIFAYLLFHTLNVYEKSFPSKVALSPLDIKKEIISLFEFTPQTCERIESYDSAYQKDKTRSLDEELQFLLFAIITETNPSLKVIPQTLAEDFKNHARMQIINFNGFLEQKGYSAY